MKTPNRKSGSSSALTTGERGSAASGTKSASNAKAAKRQSERAASNKSNDVRAPAGGTAEKSPSGKLRS
jgi:hypothetical protein